MDCLINTIGLASVETYACWSSSSETGWAADNAAKSAYYVDSSEYTPDLSNVKQLGTRLKKARTEAVDDAVLKVRVALARLAKMNIDNYEDSIGKPTKSSYAMRGLNGTKLGFRFEAGKYYKGVNIRIKKASLKIDTTGNYTVSIYRLFPNVEQVDTFDVTATAGQISYSGALDVLVPLSYEGEKAQYVAYWERTGTELPFNVESVCGCGDDPTWYSSGFLKVSGSDFDNVNELDVSNLGTNKNTHGLHFKIEFECDALGWLCGASNSFWTQNHIGTTFAKVVQLLAVKKLINGLLDENGPNAYNLLAREGMQKNTYKINNILKGLVDWLAVQMSTNYTIMSKSDCIQCKPALGMTLNELDI